MSTRTLIRVRDVMKSDFDVVDGMTTVEDALHQIEHVETKMLIVKKRHEDDEYGILLLADVARRVLAKDRAPERLNVYEVMTKPVVTVSPDMDIRYCARLMDALDFARCPVVENGEVMGVVSLTDLVLKGMAGRN